MPDQVERHSADIVGGVGAPREIRVRIVQKPVEVSGESIRGGIWRAAADPDEARAAFARLAG